MAATDLWGQAQATAEPELSVGPSDREVVALLQRVASAQAHLALAEQAARVDAHLPRRSPTEDRDRAITNAHSEVIWAQSNLITEPHRGRALKALRLADVREASILKRYGFSSFRMYLEERNAVPTSDVHLELARRESASAQEAWEALQADFAPTVIIDLTGEEPHVIS